MPDHDMWSHTSSVPLEPPLMSTDVTVETAAQNTAMFMVSRVIIGVGITPAIVGASNLISGKLSSQSQCSPRSPDRTRASERASSSGIFVQRFLLYWQVTIYRVLTEPDSHRVGSGRDHYDRYLPHGERLGLASAQSDANSTRPGLVLLHFLHSYVPETSGSRVLLTHS